MRIDVERLQMDVPEGIRAMDEFIALSGILTTRQVVLLDMLYDRGDIHVTCKLCGNIHDDYDLFPHEKGCKQGKFEEAISDRIRSANYCRSLIARYKAELFFSWVLVHYLEDPEILRLLPPEKLGFMDAILAAKDEFRKHFTEDVTKLVQVD